MAISTMQKTILAILIICFSHILCVRNAPVRSITFQGYGGCKALLTKPIYCASPATAHHGSATTITYNNVDMGISVHKNGAWESSQDK